MPDISENGAPGQPESPRSLVGDIIRKERVTSRIAIETIARDLKLNVKYIKALEANRYDDLPAEPYIRVYLRSIAKYLQLDAEGILRRFYEERGHPEPDYHKTGKNKIQITSVETESNWVPGVIVIIVIALLAGGSIVAGRMGWISLPEPQQEEPAPVGVEPQREQEEADVFAEDSLFDDMVTIEGTEPAEGEDEPAVSPLNPLHLKIKALRDSVWVQVLVDKKSWRNYIHAGTSRAFAARREILARVGKNRDLEYHFNNELLEVPGKGVVYFQIDSTGTLQTLRSSVWNSRAARNEQ